MKIGGLQTDSPLIPASQFPVLPFLHEIQKRMLHMRKGEGELTK